jgi:hypothetical protein
MSNVYENSLGEFAKIIGIAPGANIDMTKFSTTMWTDSQHTRWDNGFPRKMGGYELLDYGTNSIVRAIYVNIVNDMRRYIWMKDKSIIQVDVNQMGSVVALRDRTPVDFEFPDADNNYNYSYNEFSIPSFDGETLRSVVYLFFVPLENAKNPFTDKEKPIYYGRMDVDDPFKQYEAYIHGSETMSPIRTSGGVIVYDQRLYIFGNGGLVYFSERNKFDTIPLGNEASGGSLKLLAARPWRNGILYWSANTLYLGQQTTLAYTLTPQTTMTIVSPTSIIDGRNSTYFWMGHDQMYAYNGALSVFQNDNNRNYLFKHLNKNYLGNCWGMYLEGFTEIMWIVPKDDEKEASLAIIHNTEEKTWYKTILNRSTGITTGIPLYPIMADNQDLVVTPSEQYPIWYHDKGVNMKIGNIQYPITAFVESRMFNLYMENPQANIALQLRRFEKNIDQVGDMQLQIKSYDYPDSVAIEQPLITFSPNTTNINFANESSIFTIKFISNTIDGFFQFGPIVINYVNGSARPTTSDIT